MLRLASTHPLPSLIFPVAKCLATDDTPALWKTLAGTCLPIPLHARVDKVFVGIGEQMAIFNKNKPMETFVFDQAITSLVGSAPNTRTRIAATHPRGGTCYWSENGHSESFATELENPVACFNRGSYLIAASEGCCEVYRTNDQHLRYVAELTAPSIKPLAVVAIPNAERFGIVTKSGEVRVYEIQ